MNKHKKKIQKLHSIIRRLENKITDETDIAMEKSGVKIPSKKSIYGGRSWKEHV